MSEDDRACCSPGRRRDDSASSGTDAATDDEWRTEPATDDDPRTDRMVRVDAGTFRMGTDSDAGFPEDGEGPAREVSTDAYYVDRYAVTNAEFLEFVRDTGHTTDAERFGWSFVFDDFVAAADRERVRDRVAGAEWWLAVAGADWFHPRGPSSSVVADDLLTHPVTHVSHRDAAAYADWAGKRLPTEAEWERAARGGREGTRFPWGDDLEPDGQHRCNVWQGEFPERNTAADGYRATAPVDAFEPNGFGLWNVCGNVWEWCRDWFDADYHTTGAADRENPTGPDEGDERVMRGGSHLCHESWCNRYRLAARSHSEPDGSTGNIGFRCVVDAA